MIIQDCENWPLYRGWPLFTGLLHTGSIACLFYYFCKKNLIYAYFLVDMCKAFEYFID